jgi:hypothetical protein
MSLPKMLSGANAFEVSDFERMNIEGRISRERLGRNNVTCPVVTRNNNSPGTPKDRYGLAETIRVRATVGPFGQVLEVKFVSGSISLLPATMRAVRQWRYRPTLLDKKPVQTQQDVTIEFRPPQYSSRMSQHASHN